MSWIISIVLFLPAFIIMMETPRLKTSHWANLILIILMIFLLMTLREDKIRLMETEKKYNQIVEVVNGPVKPIPSECKRDCKKKNTDDNETNKNK
jgi:hypothetical protein